MNEVTLKQSREVQGEFVSTMKTILQSLAGLKSRYLTDEMRKFPPYWKIQPFKFLSSTMQANSIDEKTETLIFRIMTQLVIQSRWNRQMVGGA